jgi:hypothetical protein
MNIITLLCILAACLALMRIPLQLARDTQPLLSSLTDIRFVTTWMFAFFLGLLAYNQWHGVGREIVEAGILLPGSLMTRIALLDLSPLAFRIIQPAIWFFLLFLCVSFYFHRNRLYDFSAGLLLSILGLESIAISHSAKIVPGWLYSSATYAFLIALLTGLFADVFSRRASSGTKPYCSAIGSVVLVVALIFPFDSPANKTLEPMIGAHYYSWFPENWVAGYVGQLGKNKIIPMLGEYQSGSAEVFRQHHAWASEAGVDFFVYDWWPTRTEINDRLQKHLREESLPRDFQFAIQYESLDVKESDGPAFSGESGNQVFLNKKRSWRLKKHWEYLAKSFMGHKNYLKVDGKPVLFLYASRHFLGPVFEAIQAARQHVFETTGIELYLVGDEAFYNVLTYSNKKGVLLLPEYIPEWDRVAAYDALTLYNPLDPHQSQDSPDAYLQQFTELYRRYSMVCSALGVSFFPAVLPGYNDWGVRPKEAHAVVPRLLSAKEPDSFFLKSLRWLGQDFIDPKQPFIIITSWNEWNEGTQIEPAISANNSEQIQTDSDRSYEYQSRYLKELKKFKDSFKKK